MNRRQVVVGGLGMLSDLLLTVTATAGSKLKVPFTIDNGKGYQETTLINIRSGSVVADGLVIAAQAQGLAYTIGVNPSWENPAERVGKQLLLVGDYRNADMAEIPGYPSQTEPGRFWMLFHGPSQRRLNSGKIVRVEPRELLVSEDVWLGPQVSVTTTGLTAVAMPNSRKSCSPQVYVKYTYPNGPF